MRKILHLILLLCITVSGFAQITVQGHPRPDIKATKQAKSTKADASFSFDDIKYWVGEGSNKAAMVIQWNDEKEPDALVWGYKWNGEAKGVDMIEAIAKVDKRFYSLFYAGTQYGTAIGGLGFDIDGEGTIGLALNGNTTYPKYPTDGIINTSEYNFDNWTAIDSKDHWQSGWYNGYWSYCVKDSQSADFGYSGLGASSRVLVDGSWDAWNYMPDFNSFDLSNNLKAVDPYVEPVMDLAKGIFFVNEDWFGWSNGSVNFMNENYKMFYRVYSELNNNEAFGATTQYGTIYGDKFFFISKQAQDGGDTQRTPGGRLVITEAGTLKKLKGFETIGGGDGRSFIGVTESLGYIGASNGIFRFDIKNMEVGEIIEGTGGGSLYSGQIGNMAFTGKYVFAAKQSKGVFVIDPETNTIVKTFEGSFNTLVQSKDGSVWLAQKNKFIKVNPFTLESEEIAMPTGITIGDSWGAWNAGSLCASTKQNVLYWSNGGGFTGGGSKIIKYDIESNTFNGAFFTLPDQDKTYKQMFYGAGLRIDPVTDNLIMTATESGFSSHYQQNWIHIADNQGNLIKTVKLDNYYWFPAIPVFPDNYAPVISDAVSSSLKAKQGVSIDIPLGGKVTDKDNLDAAISKSASINDNTIAGVSVTNDHLIITPKAKYGTATVKLKVNSNGKTAEKEIAVNILSNPEIIKQPESAKKQVKESLTLSVEAGGGMLSYQWYKDKKAIQGATSQNYAISNLSTTDTGEYYCIITNDEGSITTNTATLSVFAQPVITTQPVSVTKQVGGNATFTIAATGGDLTYQWYKNKTAITGASTDTYTISTLTSSHTGEYYCIVSNKVGSTTSNTAQLSVISQPVITTQPTSASKQVGEAILLTVTATGGGLTYQWYRGETAITGATNSNYTINSILLADAGEYYCIASNAVGSATSTKATLTVKDKPVTAVPVITTQPKSQNSYTESSVTLSVTVTGEHLSYQWYKDNVIISQATANTYTISNLSLTNAGKYHCVISNGGGSVTSETAVLSIFSNDISIHKLLINDKEWDIEDRYIIGCGDNNEVSIKIATEADAKVLYNGKELTNKEISVNIDKPSVQDITFEIKTKDLGMTKSYTINVEKYFDFNELVITRWNNTLIINNNSATNGGYNFTAYKWYKDGSEIGDKQYYSAGSGKSDILDKDAEYYVQVTTGNGDILRTCPANITLKSMGVKAYPNPTRSGETLYIDVDIDSELMTNAVIEIYNIVGLKVTSKRVEGKVTPVTLPDASGTYLIKVRSGSFVRDLKVIVK